MRRPGEGLRISASFGVLGTVAVAVAAHLGDLQILRDAESLRKSISEERNLRPVAAPRGRLLAADGQVLAEDRPVLEVHAWVRLYCDEAARDYAERGVGAFETASRRLIADLRLALAGVPGMATELAELADQWLPKRLAKALARRHEQRVREWQNATPAQRVERKLSNGLRRSESVDLLIHRQLTSHAIVERLRALDFRRRPDQLELPYSASIDVRRRYERHYAMRDVLFGLVGSVEDGFGVDGDDRMPTHGLERLRELLPRSPGVAVARMDGRRRRYFAGPSVDPALPAEVETTIDLDLSFHADRQLDRAAEAVRAKYGSPPEWGALLLVHVPTGELRAAASWAAHESGVRDPFGAYAPTQRLCPPGSVVKPLHVAIGIEEEVYGWDRTLQLGSGGRWRIRNGRASRVITDDHPNAALDVRGILVKSSNIGAVKLGTEMGPELVESYLRNYRFGVARFRPLPGELTGSRPADMRELSPNERLLYALPSVLFGYQIQATPLQVARAYLSFLRGAPTELSFLRDVQIGEQVREFDQAPAGEPFLSRRTIDAVCEALIGVAHEGTADTIHGKLDGQRVDPGDVAGKTGTSEFNGKGVRRWDGKRVNQPVRTASFAGFSPAIDPEYLVVCVLQKVKAAKFYGGTYAAPAAVRLLLHARRAHGR